MSSEKGASNSPKVLCVGMACVDFINIVEQYPVEDSDNTRGVSYYWQGGGNASNNTTVLSLLGVPCELMGVLPTIGPEARWLQDDFQTHSIDIAHCAKKECTCSIATCIVSKNAGTRTVVYNPRDHPMLNYDDFHQAFKGCFATYSWIQFEINSNVEEWSKMLDDVAEFNKSRRRTGSTSSSDVIIGVEIEKPGLVNAESIMAKADCVFISKDFARDRGCADAYDAVRYFYNMCKPGSILVCPWGDQGATAQFSHEDEPTIVSQDAMSGVKVVDSLGAGDTFVSGFIHAALSVDLFGHHTFASEREDKLESVLGYACDLAGYKCGVFGYQCLKDFPPYEWKF